MHIASDAVSRPRKVSLQVRKGAARAYGDCSYGVSPGAEDCLCHPCVWGLLFLQYKAKLAGVHVGFVPAPNTSRGCSVCGHIAKENRESQAIFICKNCGHTENADINAAKNILGNYLKSTGGAELALGRGARVAGCEASTTGELAPPPYAHRE